ncbi:AzlC family ABC transporter permease [Azohydromonas lata]|uniref:AzlC family ABC transporter permease n=1 Tax=Azohydromonas lata TaxID=45677 RepID=A0ABU5IS24_9BURK|nr:AzlC family ABC transporter permease [Azohydromonas lata]MDZ5461683.1 AzlC family ABC transporter permease [Azohydromonas lata]
MSSPADVDLKAARIQKRASGEVSQAAWDALPIVVSGFAFGLVFGLLCVRNGLSAGAATLMSALVFAGASQFVAIDFWRDGAAVLPVATIAFTTLAVNLRHLLMSASLAPQLAPYGRGRVAAAFSLLLIDESWALSEHRFKQRSPTLRYFVACGGLIYCGWVSGSLVGTQLGATISDPARWGLDFTFIAMFLSLLVLMHKRRTDLAVSLLSAALAWLLSMLPGLGTLAVFVAALGASAVVATLTGSPEGHVEPTVPKEPQ